ncbi:MAG: hypothetical protein M3N16_08710 [Actinomycetota bacterium]|nr:hypothetical protein [Actinomycetota bacterium]
MRLWERLGATASAALAVDREVKAPPASLHDPPPPPEPSAAEAELEDVRRLSAPTSGQPGSLVGDARARWRRTRYRDRLDAAIAAPRLGHCGTIAVISPKGGVGKTTITALLGALFAYIRRDRVVAVDTNPDYGSLGPTLVPGHQVFVDDLLDLLEARELTVTELDAQLGRGPDGLMVLPAPTDPARMARLDRTAYARLIGHLQAKAGVILLDCGTGLQEPAAQAAIAAADQLVLVTDPDPATGKLVARGASLLLEAETPVVLVVNKMPRRHARSYLEQLGTLVPEAAGMTFIESNPAAAARVSTGRFTWTDPAGGWDVRVRELGALLVSQWPALGLTSGAPADTLSRQP